MRIRTVLVAAIALAAALCAVGASRDASAPGGAEAPDRTEKAMQLTSASFEQNGSIPKRHTCDGVDVSPALSWKNAPAGTKSFVLIVDDPDAPDPAAPKVVWVHWVLYNIPAASTSLAEGVADTSLPSGALQGLNDWKKPGYGGPCPPVGTHRYFHKLYALDTMLPDLKAPAKAQVEKAMEGHILARAELIGRYKH